MELGNERRERGNGSLIDGRMHRHACTHARMHTSTHSINQSNKHTDRKTNRQDPEVGNKDYRYIYFLYFIRLTDGEDYHP